MALRPHKAFVGALVFFPLMSFRSLACSCAPAPPPCQAIGQSALVFLGTVTDLSATQSSFKTAKMHVDRVFKGNLAETVELFDDGMCDGPDLQVGRQYLMYTTGFPGGAIPARGCTRSRDVVYAREDLEFLEDYVAGKTTTRISGTVRFRPDEPFDSEKGRTPLQGVSVSLNSQGGELHAITDSRGLYALSGLSPGKYEINAELSGYRLDWAPEDIELKAKGCVQADLLMKVDRRVEGVVRDADSVPVAGALVEIVSTDSRLERWQQPVVLSISDDDGSYVLDGIPPGEYYLGVNIKRAPTREHPFPRTYYPQTTDIRQAVPIKIASGVSVQRFDLHVSGKLPLVQVLGRVLKADRTPPGSENRPHVRIKEPGLVGQIEQREIVVDAEGRFSIELCEGVAYSAFAFLGTAREPTYSSPVEFTPTHENNRLELVADKTQEEFSKLTEAMKNRH